MAWLFRSVCVVAIAVSACSRTPPAKEYQLKGQILDVKPETNEVLVKHEDIKGFMPAMTMPYKVEDGKLLAGKEPGDLITATLVVGETEAHLSTIDKTGHAPIENTGGPELTASQILKPGDPVPDTKLIDENNMARPLTSYKGHRVALTFMYTRCPQPDFCPLMDRNFAALQNEIMKTPDLADVRLVSVSFDPANDTPAVLKTHAKDLKANAAVWHFVTASPEDIKGFTAKFGVTAEPSDESPAVLTHNLSTAVIDAGGKLVKIRPGNMWTPADLIGDLKAAPAPAH
ncbi:MAG TPA: SCO family protein [Vicinamibacterales bacterium]|jgi:protein SCO1|nr:SCO family protein [Vicinamibacterales bacterium]